MRDWFERLLRCDAAAEAGVVAPRLGGRRVLDVGAAENWVVAALGATGDVRACGADAGACRRAAARYGAYDGASWERRVHHPRLSVLDVPTWTRPGVAVEAPGGATAAGA